MENLSPRRSFQGCWRSRLDGNFFRFYVFNFYDSRDGASESIKQTKREKLRFGARGKIPP